MRPSVLSVKFGAVAVISFGVVGVSTGCSAGAQDREDELVEPTGTEPQGLAWCHGGTNGDFDYCGPGCAPCAAGQGDCDSNSDCQSGLVCSVGTGPKFGLRQSVDVCVPAQCTNRTWDANECGVDCGGTSACGACASPKSSKGCSGVNGGYDYCRNPNHPCSEGEGDCHDNSALCAPGLVCKLAAGPQFGLPRGTDVCVSDACGNKRWDANECGIDCGGTSACGACTSPRSTKGCSGVNGGYDYCRNPNHPCSEGEGDCHNDSRLCAPGLLCKVAAGPMFGLGRGVDVCVAAPTDAGAAQDGASDGQADGNDGGVSTTACQSRASSTLFGAISYFNAGQPLPAGDYVIRYQDGCMKYQASQWWAVNARNPGIDHFVLVGESSSDVKLILPGTTGFLPGTATGAGDQNGFATFDECVAANLALPAVTFHHTGGLLGVTLQDDPYADNLPGENGRNPEWSLQSLSPECPASQPSSDAGSADAGTDASAADAATADATPESTDGGNSDADATPSVTGVTCVFTEQIGYPTDGSEICPTASSVENNVQFCLLDPSILTNDVVELGGDPNRAIGSPSPALNTFFPFNGVMFFAADKTYTAYTAGDDTTTVYRSGDVLNVNFYAARGQGECYTPDLFQIECHGTTILHSWYTSPLCN